MRSIADDVMKALAAAEAVETDATAARCEFP
jgi:hypothetical protein